jgi:hypothetical protein
VGEIDQVFCRPGYYEDTPADEIAALEQERDVAQARVKKLMNEWEQVERSLDELETREAV